MKEKIAQTFRTFRTYKILGAIAVIAVIGGISLMSAPTSAHEDPAACNASGLQQFPSVGPSGTVYDGSTLTYAVTYINSDPDGAGAIAPCNITGANGGIIRPDGTTINVITNATLNVGDTITCPGDAECAAGPYQYVVSHADENGIGTSVTAEFDIAGVLHQDADEEVASDHDTLSKTVIHPSTLLTKTVDQNVVTAGTEVTYTYMEDNDGDVPLSSVSVVDDTCAPVAYVSGDTNLNSMLDTNETWEYSCSMVINDDTTNIATGRGLDPNGNVVTWCQDPQNPPQGFICDQDEQAQASVRVVDPLVVEKTANTSYDREWEWTIDKSADQTDLLLAEGESFTVNYSVVVDTSSVDVNHQVSGTIAITNPEGNPIATIDSVGDILDVSGTATVVCEETLPFDLAGGSTLNCTYSASSDGTDSLNTATVTTTGIVPGGSDNADVVWGDPASETDECIDVSDTNVGVLGTVCASDAPQTFNYTVTFGPEGGEGVDVPVTCGEIDHPNTASFVSNDTEATGSDDWNVHVNVECFQGCTLTQGYWKTHSDEGPAPFDDNWDNLGDVDGDGVLEQEDEMFFLSGMTWYEVFWTAPKGNAYYQLAHQYMAAYLNVLNGASTTPAVDSALLSAETFFETYTPASFNALGKKSSVRTNVINWAGTLGSYNEGLIGPGHCDEQVAPS